MPKTTKKQPPPRSVPALRAQWNDPFRDFGEAASQLQVKIPVAKIEYMASNSIQREHPEWEKGKFSLSIGEQLDSLQVGLLGLRYGRVCWLSQFDPNNPDADPECKSDNGIFPSPAIEEPLTDVKCTINGEKFPVCVHCNEIGEPVRTRSGKYLVACPMAKWGDRKSAPRCHEQFTLLLWEHQLNLPLIYTVKGTGIKHLNQLHMDMIRAIREIPEDSKYPPSSYIRIIIRATPVSNWYEPHFKIDKPFEDIEAHINTEAKKDLIDEFESMSSDDFAFDKTEEEE